MMLFRSDFSFSFCIFLLNRVHYFVQFIFESSVGTIQFSSAILSTIRRLGFWIVSPHFGANPRDSSLESCNQRCRWSKTIMLSFNSGLISISFRYCVIFGKNTTLNFYFLSPNNWSISAQFDTKNVSKNCRNTC